MSQATFSIRMDVNLKNNFANICEQLGMSMSTAINVFANSVVNHKRIPFDIELPTDNELKFIQTIEKLQNEAEKSNFNNMSLDDINNIIKKTRTKRKNK